MGFIVRRSPLAPSRDLITGVVIVSVDTSFFKLEGVEIRPIRAELASRGREVG